MAAAPMLTVIDTPLVESKVPLPRVACHCHVLLVAMYTISRDHVYDSSGKYVQSLAPTISEVIDTSWEH